MGKERRGRRKLAGVVEVGNNASTEEEHEKEAGEGGGGGGRQRVCGHESPLATSMMLARHRKQHDGGAARWIWCDLRQWTV